MFIDGLAGRIRHSGVDTGLFSFSHVVPRVWMYESYYLALQSVVASSCQVLADSGRHVLTSIVVGSRSAYSARIGDHHS